MDQLPTVLQKEIWEYVHGDRAHWRECFRQSIVEFKVRIFFEDHRPTSVPSYKQLPMSVRILATLTDQGFQLWHRSREGVPLHGILRCRLYPWCETQIRCDHEIKFKNLPLKDRWIKNLVHIFKTGSRWKDRFVATLTPKEAVVLVMLAPTCMPS
jgi:hypothetical protein